MLTETDIDRIAKRVANLLEKGGSGAVATSGRGISTKALAARLGCKRQCVTRNWRKWGLRKVGRGKEGILWCAASVTRYQEHLNQE